jgi:hypothetical protein
MKTHLVQIYSTLPGEKRQMSRPDLDPSLPFYRFRVWSWDNLRWENHPGYFTLPYAEIQFENDHYEPIWPTQYVRQSLLGDDWASKKLTLGHVLQGFRHD